MMEHLDFYIAAQLITANPGKYAKQQVMHAQETKTKGLKIKRSIAAGRDALAEVLFELYPELNGDFRKLTKAIRMEFGKDYNFEELNKVGARALGFDL